MKNLLLLLGGFVLSLNAFAQTSTGDNTDLVGKISYQEGKIVVYPNPSREVFFVQHDDTQGPIEQLMIVAHDGRKVKTYEKPKPEKFFIADVDPGVYTVFVWIAGEIYTDKLVVSDKIPL